MECLACGFELLSGQYCPKCDADLMQQRKNTQLVVDIGHHQLNSKQALSVLDEAIEAAQNQRVAKLQVITGRGVIKQACEEQLAFYLMQQRIKDYCQVNEGAFELLL